MLQLDAPFKINLRNCTETVAFSLHYSDQIYKGTYWIQNVLELRRYVLERRIETTNFGTYIFVVLS
jgi:hypothetical protein